MATKKIPLMGLLLLLSIVGSPTNAEGPICPQLPEVSTLNRAIFPEGFIFGTATAAYQVEGAADEDGRGKSMWDVYCKEHPEKCNGESGDKAVDFYHRYKGDIQLMKNLSTDAFRMSISWPRIFPSGKKAKGENKAGVQFYHDVLDELKENGITPFVTIFHWDIPQFLEDEYGGFLDEKIVEDFRDYAEFLFKEYGGKVKNWITINEPWVYAHAGYDIGKKAPGRCSEYAKGQDVKGDCLGGESGNEVFNVSHNLLLAHAEAVDAFRECKRWHHCKGKIGIAHSPAWFEPHAILDEKDPKRAREHEDTKRALDFMFGWHHKPTVDGEYPQTMIDTVGKRLPQFSEEQKKKLINSADFVGVNYYTAKFAEQMSRDGEKPRWMQDAGFNWQNTNKGHYSIGSMPKTADKEMAVYSEGLRKLLNYIKDNYENPEIMIMENGYGEVLAENANQVSVEDGTADFNRKYYLQRHLFSLYDAICVDKVNVKGYFVWSLLDNFEWQSGFKVRFGLYFVDFANNLERHIKKSGEFYKNFLLPPSDTSDQ